MQKFGNFSIEYVLSFFVYFFIFNVCVKLEYVSMEYALQCSIYELKNLLITRPLDKSALSKIILLFHKPK